MTVQRPEEDAHGANAQRPEVQIVRALWPACATELWTRGEGGTHGGDDT